MRNSSLLFLTTFAACCISIASTHAQVFVGFNPTPSGNYNGAMTSTTAGSVNVGAPSGRISFGLQTTPNTWQKQLLFNLTTFGGLNTGAIVTINEYLHWDGTGPSPFTDWHEIIQNNPPGFEWRLDSTLSIGTDNYGGTRSNGNTELDFTFAPQTVAFDFTIQKALLYTGAFIDPLVTPGLTIIVTEIPTTPEPEQAALFSGCLIALWAIGRRIYRSHHA